MKQYRIELTKEQRDILEEIVRKGQGPARKIQHAHILLKADSGVEGPNWTDNQIQEAFGGGKSTIFRVKKRYIEHGLEDALNRRPQPERPEKRKIYGEQEAHIIAMMCSPAPEGFQRWSMRLVASRLVQLGEYEQIDHTTVWRVLKKMNSNPG